MLYFEYAREDVEKGIMSWEIYLKAFKEAGKVCKFFPTYADIMEKVKEVSYKSNLQTFEALPAHRDNELAKYYLDRIRARQYKEDNKTKFRVDIDG